MKVHIYSVKAKSQICNMCQAYNDNTKRPKPKENQLGILGISSREFMHSVEIQQRALGQGETTAGATYLSLRIHPKVATSLP